MFIEQDINKAKGKSNAQQHRKNEPKDIKWHPEGKRIINQLVCQVNPPKPKLQQDTPVNREEADNDTFRELLSRRDRNKESQSRLQHHLFKKGAEQIKYDKNDTNHNKSASKSKSKSKGINKSKSLKHLVKKNKSMTRFVGKYKAQIRADKHQKEERKSESPPHKLKNTISYVQRKNCKSHYNSKTNREGMSELTTQRQKSKTKMKISQVSKPSSKKPKKVQESKKKNAKPADKKNTEKEKENVKMAKKMSKDKKHKEKHVIVSGNSKVKKEIAEDWNSSLEEEFLDPKLHSKSKQQSNIVIVPKRKERLSQNSSNNKRHLIIKNNKTEAEIENCKSRVKELEHMAAIKIQKVFRGYLTRKYIRECFEHNAAVTIQRAWRNYQAKDQLVSSRVFEQPLSRPLPKIHQLSKEKKQKILDVEEYLLQNSRQSEIKSTHPVNERWTSIFQEILSEQTINDNIKKKIETFLQSQRKEMNDLQFRSNPSNSARSSISSQVIYNQIASERNFIAYQKKRKDFPHMQAYISPTNYKSPKSIGFGSPKIQMLNSPLHHFPDRTMQNQPERTSSELLISNLKNIQKFHKQRLHSKAKDQKEELNSMLLKNKLSPRTHEKKYREVDQCLESELQKFNESINEIVKNCILYKEESPQDSGDIIHSQGFEQQLPYLHEDHLMMITPKKQLAPLQLPEMLEESCSPKLKVKQIQKKINVKFQQRSAQLGQYYLSQKAQLPKDNSFSSFDSSYQFIEEYLISLIDYLRQYENGSYISYILGCLRKPRSHQTQVILRNLNPVTQGSQDSDEENSFRLPMYKIMDLDQEIIESSVIDCYNSTFLKLQNHITIEENLQEHFVKMIGDCMNEALNSLRPIYYIFTSTQLSTINTLKAMEKVVVYEPEYNSEEQMQYQFMLALALNKIFYWNKLQLGKSIINLNSEDDNADMRAYLLKENENILAQSEVQDPWESYDEQVELIGVLTEGLFDHILCEEISVIWTVVIDWNENGNWSGNRNELKLANDSPMRLW